MCCFKQKHIKKVVLFALISAVIASVTPSFAVFALEEPKVEKVQSAYLYNIENDEVLYERNIDQKMYPTSMVKMMTAIVAQEKLSGRLDETITITSQMLKNVTGNNVGLKDGEKITIRDLFYALLVRGANDAAHVLAYISAGSVDSFVALMNEKAAYLGTLHTVYTNPSGMHDDVMYTTASDTAVIALAAYSSELIMEMSSTTKYTIPPTNISEARTLYNRNYFIAKNQEAKYFYPAARGINSGSTEQGGYCLATIAQKDGLTYLCVIMGAQSDSDNIYSYIAAKNLFNFAFEGYGYLDVIDTSKLICEIPVTLSTEADYVTLVPKSTLTVYLPMDIKPETDITYSWKVTSSELKAPVYEGQEAGFITISYGDRILGSVPLVTKNGVERSEFLNVMSTIEEFSKSRFFIATVVSGACITVIYVLIKSIYRYRKNKKRNRYR